LLQNRVNSAFLTILCGQFLLNQSTEIIIDQIPLGILTFSLKGRVEFINQNFHRLGLLYQFNTSLLNINIFKYNIFQPTNIIEELKIVIKGRPFEKKISNVKTNDGRMISLIIKGSPIYEEENISGGMLLIEDLQFLSETNQEIKTKLTDEYINKGDIFFIVTDTSGDIKYSAGKEIQSSKLLRKEITGRNINEVFNSSDNQNIIQLFRSAIEFGKAQFLQIDFSIGNDLKKFDCAIEPVINENGFVQVVYLVFKESPLPQEEILSMVAKVKKLDLYSEISKRNDSGFLLVDKNGVIIECDEQFRNISRIEITVNNISFTEIFTSITHEILINISHQLNDDNSCELTTNLKTELNEFSPVNLIFFKSKIDKTQMIVLCSRIKLNTTVIKQSEVKPVKTDEKIEQISQPMCRINLDGTIFFANEALLTLLGYQNSEWDLISLFDVIDEADVSKIRSEISNLSCKEKKSIPIRLRHKPDGIIDFNLIIEAASFSDNKINSVNCFFANMNYVVQTSAPHIYQAMFEAATDGIVIELDNKIIHANDSFAKIFGYKDVNELIGKNILELVSESVTVVPSSTEPIRCVKPV